MVSNIYWITFDLIILTVEERVRRATKHHANRTDRGCPADQAHDGEIDNRCQVLGRVYRIIIMSQV